MNMPPFWAMYVGVPKLEDAVAHIKRHGGKEWSPVIDIPTVGRMQMMTDPQGAAFYIYRAGIPTTPQQPEGAPAIGEASWHELMTTDAPAAMKFYTELFGWQPSETMDMGPMGKYHMFNRPHGMIGGMMNKPPEMAQVPPNWADLFPRPRHQRGGRAHQSEWRADPQRPDGSARRRQGRRTPWIHRARRFRCTRRRRSGSWRVASDFR